MAGADPAWAGPPRTTTRKTDRIIGTERSGPRPPRSLPVIRGAAAFRAALLLPLALGVLVHAGATLAVAAEGGPAAEIAGLLEAGRVRAAADRAHTWAEAEPGNLEALRLCAVLGGRVGDYRVAEDALRSLVFFTPHDPDVLVMLGEVLTDRGRYEDAREQFQAAIRLDDSLVGAYVGLSRLATCEGAEVGETISAAQVAMSVGPQEPAAVTAMGEALNACGRPREALEHLHRALALDAGHPPALFALGLSHALLDERDEALTHWRHYLQVEPETAQAWLLRTNLLVTRSEPILERAWYACYSPDGARIAYRSRGPGGWGIYVCLADDPTQEQRIWATQSSLYSLSWSPDGASLVTRVYEKIEVEEKGKKKTQWVYRIVVIPSDGKGESRQLIENRWLGEPAWIPGSNHIGVRSYVPKQGYVMLDIDPATGDSQPLAGLEAKVPYYSPCWSRDGSRWLAVRRSAMHPDGSYTYELLAGPADSLDKISVIFETPDYLRNPVFSPDGSLVLFTVARGQGSSRYPVWAMPADGSREPCLLYHEASSYTPPSLSPDSKYMLSSREQTLVRLTLDGVRPRLEAGG